MHFTRTFKHVSILEHENPQVSRAILSFFLTLFFAFLFEEIAAPSINNSLKCESSESLPTWFLQEPESRTNDRFIEYFAKWRCQENKINHRKIVF